MTWTPDAAVGLDYLPASRHAPGAGRYARELVRALVARADAPSLRLLEFGRAPAVMDDDALGLDPTVIRVRRALPRRLLHGSLARAGWTIDRWAGRCALFHHVVEPRPPTSRRVRATAALAEWDATTDWRARLAGLDGVFAFTRSGAEAIVASGAIDAERVVVTPVGCDHWRRDAAFVERPEEPPIFLVLGAPRPERHPEAILAAFETLRGRGLEARLVFVGAGAEQPGVRAFAGRLSASRHGDAVRWETPDERTIAGLVARAATLVHLHAAEATPVTALEAWSFGLSVVGSDVPAFREALGDDFEDVPHDVVAAAEGGSPEPLADRLAAALASGVDARARRERAERAGAWTWDRCAAATIDGWRRIAELPPRPFAP